MYKKCKTCLSSRVMLLWRRLLSFFQHNAETVVFVSVDKTLLLAYWAGYMSMFLYIHCLVLYFIVTLSHTDKTIKLWKVSERDKRPEGYNLKDEEGRIKDISTVTSLQVSVCLSNYPRTYYSFSQLNKLSVISQIRIRCRTLSAFFKTAPTNYTT